MGLAILSVAAASSGIISHSKLGSPRVQTGPGWSIIASPNTDPTEINQLRDVACSPPSLCWATGSYYNGSNSQTLIEQWNGTTWSLIASPNTSTTQDNYLQGVTCASASLCWAVGFYNAGSGFGPYRTLIEQWNGTSWSIVSSPNPSASENYLNNVTCSSASQCWAVGLYYDGSSYQTLIEQWDGISWSVVASPITGGNLYGVTCTSTSQCWAAGVYGGGTLIERWDGISWTVVPSPNPSPLFNDLYSVTCALESQCWAVGDYFNIETDTFQTLIEQWDGASWSVVPSPNTSTAQPNFLNRVTCASASQCWAVGDYDTFSTNQTLIEHWNGTSWSIVPSPNPSTTLVDGLAGVACASTSHCWAVGDHDNGNVRQTLIEEYSLTSPPLTSVVSRMTHGLAAFDIDLPLTGTPAVECRIGVGGVSGNYSLVFSFVNNLTSVAEISTSNGSVSSSSIGPGPNQFTVNLAAVTDQQYVTVTLGNALDSQGNIGTMAATMGVLVGDANGDRLVDRADRDAINSGRGLVRAHNFRDDLNVDGVVNRTDRDLVRANE